MTSDILDIDTFRSSSFQLKRKNYLLFSVRKPNFGKKNKFSEKNNNVYILKPLNVYNYANSDSPFQSYSY